MDQWTMEPGSFRDRTARVFHFQGGIYRGLGEQASADWARLSGTGFFRKALDDGRVVATEQVDPESEGLDVSRLGEWRTFLRHQRIPFLSYPYEWSFGMLKDAAISQLELMTAALDEDFILKDASAFNTQWIGTRPVFIDTGSFESLEPGGLWSGYRQFCELFLIPLFFQAYKNIPFHPWLRGSIDGVKVQDFRRMLSMRDFLRPGVFTHVYLQAKLESRFSDSNENMRGRIQSAGFHKAMIQNNVARMRKLVEGLTWRKGRSEWSHYASEHNYTSDERQAKVDFVRDAVARESWGLVWDLGCNTGDYAKLAAEKASCVVAMDADHLAVERLYQELRSTGNSTILPLVGNVADASPALGWRGMERHALTDRGHPDLVLALALIHHVVISANIPLAEFVDWVTSLCRVLVIEFVAKDDPMVQKLLRNKKDIYDDYTQDNFEDLLNRRLEIVQQLKLPSGTRTLYLARQRRVEAAR